MLDGTRMSIFQKIFSEDFNRIYHSGCEVLYTVQLPGTGNKMVHGVLASTSSTSVPVPHTVHFTYITVVLPGSILLNSKLK